MRRVVPAPRLEFVLQLAGAGGGGEEDAACEAAKPNGISVLFLLLLLFPPPLISPRPRHLGALTTRGPHPFKPALLRGDCGEVAYPCVWPRRSQIASELTGKRERKKGRGEENRSSSRLERHFFC